jgi:hypothetical protein
MAYQSNGTTDTALVFVPAPNSSLTLFAHTNLGLDNLDSVPTPSTPEAP